MIGFSREDTALLYRMRDERRRRQVARDLEERAFQEEVAQPLDIIVHILAYPESRGEGDAAFWRWMKGHAEKCWDRYGDRLKSIRRITRIDIPSRDPRVNP